jgi:hypothetical protein
LANAGLGWEWTHTSPNNKIEFFLFMERKWTICFYRSSGLNGKRAIALRLCVRDGIYIQTPKRFPYSFIFIFYI